MAGAQGFFSARAGLRRSRLKREIREQKLYSHREVSMTQAATTSMSKEALPAHARLDLRLTCALRIRRSDFRFQFMQISS
ncbi:bsr3733 [Bradyrhizobium diazoefficiens USDA 110]|uniref:Bsr3733 protein n=1 Tax=Bradyrhizobium diazoefficiens (strain JCM 10833 / BCRC 13528 / IAM 13628 / NBRC 14792 / USDA 110) TaxID=224911 RepID=Q89NV1_BRADU|nr:hypothetical protein CO678_18450 [Bradyrhizobium diazoefficiens]QBP22504.1 hypothetical protein Bdiaspc4_19260 [Bradyrhizobium diazoefficiens]QHP71214.1 hypothetical protein EI171_30310 [Bradyrhizobium sp. LCT2]BAC48998.1 bsr3733 [Bradyrhizobium diazoefficiens USDA 110]